MHVNKIYVEKIYKKSVLILDTILIVALTLIPHRSQVIYKVFFALRNNLFILGDKYKLVRVTIVRHHYLFKLCGLHEHENQ